MSSVLKGLKVLDFSRVFAGPASAQILGDLGADVVKIEVPVVGDEARYYGATSGKLKRADGLSPSFVAFNRNKRSLALDLRSKAGQRVARRLAEQADVVINNFRPGTMDRFGLGYEALKAVNPGLICCDLYAYGNSGPLANFGANDLALQAHSGLLSVTGEPDRPPVRVGAATIDLASSLCLVNGILAAVIHRMNTGEGQRVETSLLRSAAFLMSYFYTEYWMEGTVRTRMGTANHLSVPNQTFETKDGSVVLIAPSDEMWHRLAQALDPARLDIEDYRTALLRQKNRLRLVADLETVTRGYSSAELVRRLGAEAVNIAKVNSIAEAAEDEQLAAIGGVMEIALPEETLKAVTSPFALSRTPPDLRLPPPRVGEHRDAVLRDYGFSDEEIGALAGEGAFGKAA